MWTWISEDARDADRVLREVLAPTLRRDPDSLSDQLCVGPAAHCAELLSRYAEAGCERVYLGHSETRRGRSSSQRRPCSQPSRRDSGRPKCQRSDHKQPRSSPRIRRLHGRECGCQPGAWPRTCCSPNVRLSAASTVRLRSSNLFPAIAGAAELFANGPIRRDVQAPLAVARPVEAATPADAELAPGLDETQASQGRWRGSCLPPTSRKPGRPPRSSPALSA